MAHEGHGESEFGRYAIAGRDSRSRACEKGFSHERSRAIGIRRFRTSGFVDRFPKLHRFIRLEKQKRNKKIRVHLCNVRTNC
jgi:hypothetical protein